MSWQFITLAFLLVAACAPAAHPPSSEAPLTEKTYRDAARYCHSREVIRMRRGKQNVFYLGGLVSPEAEAARKVAASHIECVRKYLGVSPEDVVVMLS